MKKAVVAAVLITAMGIFSFLNAGYLKNIRLSLESQLEQTREYVIKENYSAARAELEDGLHFWKESGRYTGILLPDEVTDSITDGFYDVAYELASGNRDTAESEIDRLLNKVQTMAASEAIVWENLF